MADISLVKLPNGDWRIAGLTIAGNEYIRGHFAARSHSGHEMATIGERVLRQMQAELPRYNITLEIL